MKQIILAALLCAPVLASAAPFVVSDPTTEPVTNYLCSIDGGADASSAPETVTGGVRLKYDLTGITTGSHTLVCKANNSLWGIASAASSPFFAIKPASLIAPKTLIIVP